MTFIHFKEYVKCICLMKSSCCCMKIEQNPYQFFFSTLEASIKLSNSTSNWVQYPARWETGDSRAVTSIQEHLSRIFSIPLLLFFCACCLSGTEAQCYHVHKSVEWPIFGFLFESVWNQKINRYRFSLSFTQPILLLIITITKFSNLIRYHQP